MTHFENLLFPISKNDFFESYWRKQPLYVVQDKNFSDFLTLEDINDYLGRSSLIYPFCRLVTNGNEIPLANYVQNPDSTFNLLNKDSVIKLFNEGATLVIQAAQLQMGNTGKLIQELETELDMDINANIYITPSNAKGFFPHFDTHEVLVLQISGTKYWNIYDIPVAGPMKGESLTVEQQKKYMENPPAHEISMQPGDVLYVPRGVVHDAYCKDELSVHITLGISPTLRIDLVKRLLKSLESNHYLREPFESGLHRTAEDPQKIMSILEKAFKTVLQRHGSTSMVDSKYKQSENWFAMVYAIDNALSINELTALNLVPDSNKTDEFTDKETSILNSLREISGPVPAMENELPEFKTVLKSLLRRGLIKMAATNLQEQ